MSFDRTLLTSDGSGTAHRQSEVRVSFLLGLEPLIPQSNSDFDDPDSDHHVVASVDGRIPETTAVGEDDYAIGSHAEDVALVDSAVATAVDKPKEKDLDEQTTSLLPHAIKPETNLGRQAKDSDAHQLAFYDDSNDASRNDTAADTISETLISNDLVDMPPYAVQHYDRQPDAEVARNISTGYEPLPQDIQAGDRWPSAEYDFDSILGMSTTQATTDTAQNLEKQVQEEEGADAWGSMDDAAFVCYNDGQLTHELPEDDAGFEPNSSKKQSFVTPSAVEEDVFESLANQDHKQSENQGEDRDPSEVDGQLFGAEAPAEDDFFSQIANEQPEQAQIPESMPSIEPSATSASQAPALDSLWADAFADEPLLDDAEGDLAAKSAKDENLANTSLTSAVSWENMTKEVKQTKDSSPITTTSKDLNRGDTPDLADLLGERDVVDREQINKPAELSWDDAFADDDDFLAGFAAAASATTDTQSKEMAEQTSQPDVSTEGSKLSGGRQSYVPSTAQSTQPTRAASSQWPQAYSAVPQPSLPAQNPVEPTVRAAGTYSSPYDMPDDFVKMQPRKRTSSNLSSTYSPNASAGFLSMNPPSRTSSLPQSAVTPQQPPRAAPSQATQQGFFEDLPFVPKKRATTPSARYGPQTGAGPNMPPPPIAANGPIPHTLGHSGPPSGPLPRSNSLYASQPPAAVQPPSNIPPPMLQRPTAAVSQPSLASQLQAPIRLDPYADDQGPMRSATVPTVPATSRYSPAPASSAASGAQSRYALQPAPRPSASQYTPRTSSPLTYQPISQDAATVDGPDNRLSHQAPHPHSFINRSQSVLETVQENGNTAGPIRESSSPPSRVGMASTSASPRKRGGYTPLVTSLPSGVAPPIRSQTSSPGASSRITRTVITTLERPASAHGALSPTRTSAPLLAPAYAPSPLAARQVSHQPSQIIPPNDERATDPLQRWRGHPVMAWGSGGSIITAFPTYLPRYVSGQALPLMQPGGGEFKVRSASGLIALPEHFAKFPGPLKKGKKKDLALWLKNGVERLESQAKFDNSTSTKSTFDDVRMDERILLWKILSLLIEHDGVLDGTPAVKEAVKSLLSQQEILTSVPSGLAVNDTVGSILPDASSAIEVGALRTLLKTGEAEKAVWHAVDQRLWGPAFLISSTLSKEIWKQVIQEFVRKEVRDKALAALFQVFAGNWDESIDELVSVSARAGFQMVNTSTGPTGQEDALAGLEKWRETLLLILSNRSPGDAQALVAIGRVLSGYGRYEAAHICFIFAGLPGIFGGSEDPTATFSLVGGDPNLLGNDFGGDMESILLSEIYEYALSVAPTPVNPVPHLQAYKLYHAETLADNGFRSEAQQYCDAVNTTIHSKTKSSPYYNVVLMQSVDSLQKRLSEAPLDSSSSWKPSIDKVSSSLWGKFNSFVAGEDKLDGSSNPTGTPPEPGQFQRFAGDTPPMSNTPITNTMPDLYGAYQSSAPSISSAANPRYPPAASAYVPHRGAGAAGNRYQPGASSYQPRSSLESSRSSQDGRTSFDNASLSPKRTPGASNLSSLLLHDPYQPNGADHDPTGSPYQSSPANSSPYGSHAERRMSQPATGVMTPQYPQHDESSLRQPQHPPTLASPCSPNSTYNPGQTSFYGTPDASHEIQSPDDLSASSYEAPASSYEPYDYQPGNTGSELEHASDNLSSVDDKKPKKKSFMDDDDDDDLIARAAALKNSKPAAYREPDDAVRRAAEADAARPQALNHKSSWFGGLSLFSKKQQADLVEKKAVRAHLGEQSSFVFDPELKKWVNKAAVSTGSSTPTGTPAPPKSTPKSTPPRSSTPAGGPSAPSLGLMGPPRPPSSIGSGPPMSRSTSMQASAASRPSTSGGPSPAPPLSRPGTAMSNASEAEDIMASAGPRTRGAKQKKKGRYVDIMANKAAS